MAEDIDTARAWMAGSGLALSLVSLHPDDIQLIRAHTVASVEHLPAAERGLALLDAIVNLQGIARAYHLAARQGDHEAAAFMYQTLENVFFERLTEQFGDDV